MKIRDERVQKAREIFLLGERKEDFDTTFLCIFQIIEGREVSKFEIKAAFAAIKFRLYQGFFQKKN